MCSILCSNKDIKDHDDVNYYLQFRGPDGTSIVKDEVNNFTFLHNLLSMTGEITQQPFHHTLVRRPVQVAKFVTKAPPVVVLNQKPAWLVLAFLTCVFRALNSRGKKTLVSLIVL